MVWNTTWPDGTIAVGDNTLTGQANTTYVETTMNVDHYWNIGGDEDGHHKFVQSPKTETGGTPSDPTVATGMDGAIYLKQKTAAEAPDFQGVLPFFKDDQVTPGVMEMLGIRACCTFNGRATNGAATITYNHNVASVTRTGAGLYTVTYTTALPSVNYLVYSGQTGTTAGSFIVQGYVAALTEVKTASLCKLLGTTGSALFDPGQAWFVCFGG